MVQGIEVMRKIALVTGGSRGIGKSIVKELSSEYDVYFTYQKSAKEARSLESQYVHSRQVDSHDYVAIKNVVEDIVSIGPISVLVNNAGITRDKTCRKMLKEEWDEVVSVNLNSAFYYTQACLDGMIGSGWGRIINISSVIGIIGGFGQANYAAAKAGLIGFSRSLALEVALKGITVNTVAPGYIDTDMTKEIPPGTIKILTERIPLKRFGTCSEISSFVRFLASEASSYITGQVFQIDGGLT